MTFKNCADKAFCFVRLPFDITIEVCHIIIIGIVLNLEKISQNAQKSPMNFKKRVIIFELASWLVLKIAAW